jgi:hypothetical protein
MSITDFEARNVCPSNVLSVYTNRQSAIGNFMIAGAGWRSAVCAGCGHTSCQKRNPKRVSSHRSSPPETRGESYGALAVCDSILWRIQSGDVRDGKRHRRRSPSLVPPGSLVCTVLEDNCRTGTTRLEESQWSETKASQSTLWVIRDGDDGLREPACRLGDRSIDESSIQTTSN